MTMAYDLISATGAAPAFAAGSAKFGAQGLASGAGYNTTADLYLSSTGAAGGTFNVAATVQAWFKSAVNPSAVAVIVGRLGWHWIGATSAGKLSWTIGGSAAQNTNVTIVDGNWHHLAVQFISGSYYLLCDGVVVDVWATTNVVAGGTGNAFTIGGSCSSSGALQYSFTSASIDEVLLSTTVDFPGANALAATYTVPTAATADARANLRALYHLDGAASDTAGATVAPPTILATDANIVYSPGNWGVVGATMKTINCGAYLRAAVVFGTGVTALELNFDVAGISTPLPQVAFRIDRGPWQTAEVAASVPITLPANTWTNHLVEVVVKSASETQTVWSPQNTAVIFRGLTATGGTCVTTSTPTRALRGLAFGDSIAAGVKTLRTGATKDTDNNDSRLSWASLLTDLLGAEVGVVGFGGQAIGGGGVGGVPNFPTSYTQLWGGGPARSFTGYDFIAINQGTNGAGEASAGFITAYTAVINALLTASSSSTMILCIRPFNGSHAADIQAAVAACANPKRVLYVDTTGLFNTADSGDSTHPYGYVNVQATAPAIARAARSALSMQKTVLLNLGGVTVPAIAFGG